jgi:hypothetical protein
MSSMDSFGDRLSQKLAGEKVASLSSAGAQKPGVQRVASSDSFEGKIQQKMGSSYHRLSSVDTMDALESNLSRPKSTGSSQQHSYESRLQKKLQKSYKPQTSNTSAGSDHSPSSHAESITPSEAQSKKSVEDSPKLDKSTKSDSSFKKNLRSQLAKGQLLEKKNEAPRSLDASGTSRGSELDDGMSLDEKIKLKKAKALASGERRGKRRHKHKKESD